MPDGSSRGRLGVDIGGTFTDLVWMDDATGAVRVGKLLTTPKDPAQAVEQGVLRLLEDAGAVPAGVRSLIHGTTLATNALIERKGARTGLLTTAGFRDALEIGREGRYDMYDLLIDPPAPLVPRHLRAEVQERMAADGTVMRALDPASAGTAIAALLAEGVEAIAISLLHAYRNPDHEAALARLVVAAAPGLPVSCSSEVAPEIREYERTSTTVANVYVMPLMARYLGDLERKIAEIGIAGGVYVMLSSGGIATPATAKRVPVRLVESGPAAGALAAARAARLAGEERLLSFDMGGTTAKACVIDRGDPLVAREFEVARADRFKKGSGLPIRVPVIELIEIGAGGGSVARLDRMNLLKVGPDSAGADPGPACYALGGREPTVTDADLVLGYLDPDFFLGGRMRLDVEAARRAITDTVARPMGIDLARSAWNIHLVVNENMAAAARIHGIERGKDLRTYPLFAFGGAGPVHAWHVGRILRVPRVLVPFGAGAASALGLLSAPLAFDFVRTAPQRLDAADWARVNRLYAEMEAEGREVLRQAGVAEADIRFRRSAEMRYMGQGHEVEGPVPAGTLDRGSLAALTAGFETAYRALYHRTPMGVPIEALNWRLVVSGPEPTGNPPCPIDGSTSTISRGPEMAPALPQSADNPRSADSPRRPEPKATRQAYFPDAGGYVETPVYDRYALEPGMAFAGPAIVEERESTTIIGPGARVRVDPIRTLVAEPA
ncbi:MAG TPA: hydantoinase/oxoprolinase family protein [Methylomirabilota bacterium]|nr:hydantoinase/oxoprolinase family protein [Methylomirabilota bacterium]